MDFITPIIAEATNTFMGEFVYAGLALLAGIASGIGIMAYFRKAEATRLEQPIATQINGEVNVRTLDKFATRDFVTERHAEVGRRLDSHDKEISALRDDMKEERRNNEVHASQRSAGLHSKIESVRSELTDKIDDMPNRIIDQLSKLNLLRKPHDDR